MLDNLRKFGSSLVGKILVGFLLIGLAGFGISGVLTGLVSTNVAKVGGEVISIQEFSRAYNGQLNQAASQLGSIPTPEQALLFGLPGTTVNRLAAEKALNAFTQRLGLGASDEQLNILLTQDPSFGGVLGNFDRDNFQQALRQNGFTESDYVRTLLDSARRQQFVLATFGDINAPKTGLDIINRYQNDQRTVEYFTFSPDAALPPADPTTGELQAHLTENQTQFRTVPTRTASFIVLTPSLLADSIEVSEQEILTEFDRSKLSLIKIEKRDINQVVLANADDKTAFEAALAEGKNFDAIVTELGLTSNNLGALTQAAIVDKNLADAAFSLAEGGITILPGALGSRAITVSNIAAGGEMTLEEARTQLETKIRTTRSRSEFIEVLDQIEELRAAFNPIEDIAKRFNLTLSTVTFSSLGDGLEEVADLPHTGRARVASSVFGQELGKLTPSVSLGTSLNVWYDLTAIDEARDQTLADVSDQITTIMLDQRIDDGLAEEAKQAIAALESGTPIATIAAGKALFAEISAPITRDGGAALTGDIAAEVFNGGPSHFGSVRTSDGSYVVFQVIELTAAEGELEEQGKTFLNEAIRDDLFNQFSIALRDDAGVEIYQQTLEQAIGLNGGSGLNSGTRRHN